MTGAGARVTFAWSVSLCVSSIAIPLDTGAGEAAAASVTFVAAGDGACVLLMATFDSKMWLDVFVAGSAAAGDAAAAVSFWFDAEGLLATGDGVCVKLLVTESVLLRVMFATGDCAAAGDAPAV